MEGGRALLAAAAVGAGFMALYRAWNVLNEGSPSRAATEDVNAVAAEQAPVVGAVVDRALGRGEGAQPKKKKKNRRKNKRKVLFKLSSFFFLLFFPVVVLRNLDVGREKDDAGGEVQRSEGGAGRTLFISGIEEDQPGGGRKLKKAISAVFASYGPRTVKVCVTHQGRTRGWAHVTLTTPAAAAAALAGVGPTIVVDGRVLHVSMATDKRDILFPSLSGAQREQLLLDSVALFSVSDELSSARIASLLMGMAGAAAPASSLLSSFLLVNERSRESDTEDVLTMSVPPPRQDLVVTDATACVGGMTFPLARVFSHVIAIEYDSTRYNYLMHNGGVCGLTNIEYHSGDYTKLYPDFVQDIVVIDPPWGGPQYTQAALPDLFLGETSLTELALHLRHHCDMLCVRLPLNYNAEDLVDRLLSAGLSFSTVTSPPAADAVSPPLGATSHVHDEWVRLTPSRRGGPGDSDGDHPFIYRVEFDVSRLLIVCYPPRARSRVRFSLANLDAVIFSMNAWNVAHGRQHHPAFYDWDKRRWVPLSRWHGTSPTRHPAPAPAAAPAAAAATPVLPTDHS